MQASLVGRRILIFKDSKVICYANPSWHPMKEAVVHHEGHEPYNINNHVLFSSVDDEKLSWAFNVKFLLGVQTYKFGETVFELNRGYSVCTIGQNKVFLNGDEFYTDLDPEENSIKLFLIAVLLLRKNRYSIPIYSPFEVGHRFFLTIYNSLCVQALLCCVLYFSIAQIIGSHDVDSPGDAIARTILFLLVFFDIIVYIFNWRNANEHYSRGTGLWVTNICFCLVLLSFFITNIVWVRRCKEDSDCGLNIDSPPHRVSQIIIYVFVFLLIVPYDVYVSLFR